MSGISKPPLPVPEKVGLVLEIMPPGNAINVTAIAHHQPIADSSKLGFFSKLLKHRLAL
jgi:hypothetical protein